MFTKQKGFGTKKITMHQTKSENRYVHSECVSVGDRFGVTDVIRNSAPFMDWDILCWETPNYVAKNTIKNTIKNIMTRYR